MSRGRDSEYISGRMLRLEEAGSRPGGRAGRRLMDAVKEVKTKVSVRRQFRGLDRGS